MSKIQLNHPWLKTIKPYEKRLKIKRFCDALKLRASTFVIYFSLDIIGKLWESTVGTRSGRGLRRLFVPSSVQNVRFIHAKLGHLNTNVIGLDMLDDISLWRVIVRRWTSLGHNWHSEPVGLGHRSLPRRDKRGVHHARANGLRMGIVARTGQLFLTSIVVVVESIHTRTVTVQFLPHWEMSTSSAESLRFLVVCGRWRCNFLDRLILQLVDVDLFDSVPSDAHRPAVRSGYILWESPRLRLVAIWWGQGSIPVARVVLIEAFLVGTKGERWRIGKVFGLVKVTRLVEHAVADVLRVLLQAGEATRFAEGELLLRDRHVQWSHFANLFFYFW